MEHTAPWVGYLALGIFALGILVVSLEEFLDLRKSKPMLLAAGLIWLLIGWSARHDQLHLAEAAVRQNLLQYAELLLLILVVMTYINAMTERRVFATLRARLGGQGYSYRQLFWITGLATFVLSPFLDNLSTTLLMGVVCWRSASPPGSPSWVRPKATTPSSATSSGPRSSPWPTSPAFSSISAQREPISDPKCGFFSQSSPTQWKCKIPVV
jgi:hypothetical protein